MNKEERNAGKLKLLGGAICLDFINTVDWRDSESPVEFLNIPDDLVVWSRHAGVISAEQAQQISPRTAPAKPEARRMLEKALDLRENLHLIFTAIAKQDPVGYGELEKFNTSLSWAMPHAMLVPDNKGFSWDFILDWESLEQILFPVIRSAAELLVSNQLGRIRKCADTRCGWLFLDTSRNRSRRWCDMRDCGNRAKASRFYRRRQKSGQSCP